MDKRVVPTSAIRYTFLRKVAEGRIANEQLKISGAGVTADVEFPEFGSHLHKACRWIMNQLKHLLFSHTATGQLKVT
jgi:hypothetical protein